MTPIVKNIVVVDEFGNEYEATYPKRAKGLVKNGRARFIDENTICLACPPVIKLEDNDMSENKKVDVNVKVEPEIAAVPEVETEKLTMNYCLEQIEKILAQTDYITAAIANLGNTHAPTDTYDIAGSEKNQALGEIVKAREATNQRLIAFYEKMYDDLKPKKKIETERLAILRTVIETLGEGITPIESKEALTDILGMALQDLSKNI